MSLKGKQLLEEIKKLGYYIGNLNYDDSVTLPEGARLLKNGESRKGGFYIDHYGEPHLIPNPSGPVDVSAHLPHFVIENIEKSLFPMTATLALVGAGLLFRKRK